MISELKNELILLLTILVVIGPYLLLFYKKVSLRIRLLFVSLGEIFIFCVMISFKFFGSEIAVETSFFYEQFAVISIFLNIILIFFSGLFTKIKQIDKT
ncbi:MAG: hypothetical protein JWP94_3491 [Mucilaginibacter sp.]|nr:hypothetical protein [Mucilaginibacter sp.]